MAEPVPALPALSVFAAGVTVTVAVSDTAQTAPFKLAVATVSPALIATPLTVGKVEHVPLTTNLEEFKAAIASENVATTLAGMLVTLPEFGVRLARVGAVLSIVIAVLAAEAVDGLPSEFVAVPAFTVTVIVPPPLQLLTVNVAPAALTPVTFTVQLTPVSFFVTPAFVRVLAVAPVYVNAIVDVPEEFIKTEEGAANVAVGPTVLIVYVLATAEPVPLFPARSVMPVGDTVTITFFVSAQVPPVKVAVATVAPELMTTPLTVGNVAQSPVTTKSEVDNAVTASLNVATTLAGAAATVAVAGVKLARVGPVLSTTIVALGAEVDDGFPLLSVAVPAFTVIVIVPSPLQLLTANVAPAPLTPLTFTVQLAPDSFFVTPAFVRVLAVASVYVSAIVDVPEEFINTADGVPRDAVGPIEIIV